MNTLDDVRRYAVIAIIFTLSASILGFIVFLPPTQNLPKGPISVYAGILDLVNETDVYFELPSNNISVRVNFNMIYPNNRNNSFFTCIMVPYTITDYTVYSVLDGNTGVFTPILGSHSTYNLTSDGVSIVNATWATNSTFFSYFSPSETIGLQIDMHIKEPLCSIEDAIAGSETSTYTFFGDSRGVFSDKMEPYIGMSNEFSVMNSPFIAQIQLPSSFYLSESQPQPIEYYIKQDNKWAMFTMDFLNGRYAQTLVCNMNNPTLEPLRELIVFFIGITSTLSISFAFEAWTTKRKEAEKKKDLESTDHE